MATTKPAGKAKKADPDDEKRLGFFSRLRFTVGTWSWDGKTGQWTRKGTNRRRKGVEYHGRTRAQREKDRKAAAARKLKKDQAHIAARWARDRARAEREQNLRDRAEAQPTVTVTGVGTWGHSGAQEPGTRVVAGEVLGSRDQLAIEAPAAGLCGAQNKTGGRCMRVVAADGTCPVPGHSAARRRPPAKRTTPTRKAPTR